MVNISLIVLIIFLLPINAFAAAWAIDDNYEVEYQIVNDNIQITFTLKNYNIGWMTVIFGEFLFPADSIVVWWNYHANRAMVWDAYNPGIPTFVSFPSPVQDIDPIIKIEGGSVYNNRNNVRIVSQSNKNGVITIVCERALITRDIFDEQLYKNREVHVMAGYNHSMPFVDQFSAVQPGYYPAGRQGSSGTVFSTSVWKIP